MTVLWFIIGIALILCIARYNESNKLFWTLLFSFIMGFAGTKMILGNHHDEQSGDNLTQTYSTHVYSTMPGTCTYYTPSNLFEDDNVVTAQHHVGQGLSPVLNKVNATLSGVFGRTRDQPLLTIIKPPELCLRKDFSTLHDTG